VGSQSDGFRKSSTHPTRYDDTAFTGTLAELNRKLSGRNSGLADTYGLSAEDLAELLNAWRDRAMRS
jgi:hypothetical protein